MAMAFLQVMLMVGMLNLCSTGELKGRLMLAQILFRHGDRMPVDPYPTDPWNDLKFWPCGWGQLTNTGKVQQYSLGQWLKKRYSTLINDTYSKDDIYIQSTDVDRTLMSALSNLAGLYPPENTDVWNKNIAWQPIPVHTIPEHQDSVLAAKKACPAYKYALNKLMQSDEFKKINLRYKYLYDYLSEYTGRTINSLENVEKIYNTLYIEDLYNKTLPSWTKKIYPGGDFQYISGMSFATITYTRQLAKLKSGPLLKEILYRFKSKLNGKLKPNRSLWMYSGHDTTIANILNTLKLFEYHSPPYASSVIFEMRIYNEIPLVSIYYKNSSLDPLPLHIPNCGIQCSLKDMFLLYNDVIPTNWESECKQTVLSTTFENADIHYLTGFLMLVSVISLILLALLLIIFYCKKIYRGRQLYVQIE